MSSSTRFAESEPLMATQPNPAVCKKSPVAMTGRQPDQLAARLVSPGLLMTTLPGLG
jgi:hypothetical protein